MKQLKTFLSASIACGFILALAACGNPSSNEPGGDGLTIVTVRHSWLPDDVMMPIVAAKQKGYYKEEGLRVVDQVGNGGATAAQLVANGDVMIGVGEAANVLNARSKGLPIVNIGTQIQSQPNCLVSMKSSGIKSWKDLVRRKIGTTTTSSGHVGLLATLKAQGIKENDVELVNFPAGAALTSLPLGKVDAAGTFLGNIAAVPFRDDLNVLTFAEGGYDAPSTGYFVHEKTLKNNKDMLVRWLRATLKGLRYTLDHPAEVGQMLASEYANVKAEDVTAKWELDKQFVDTPTIKEHGLGYQVPSGWDQLAQALAAVNAVPAGIDVKAAYTNDVVKQIDVNVRS